VKVGIALIEEIVRLSFEKLQVILKYSESVTELVWVCRRTLIAGNILGHIHKGLSGDIEHLVSFGFGHQSFLCRWERRAAATSVQRVSNAQFQQLTDGKRMLAQ